METDHTGDLLDYELSRRGVAANESESYIIAVLIGCDHGGDQGVWSGVLVDIRCVNLLGELWLFVVFILRIYPNCRCAGLRWLA